MKEAMMMMMMTLDEGEKGLGTRAPHAGLLIIVVSNTVSVQHQTRLSEGVRPSSSGGARAGRRAPLGAPPAAPK
ncbi:hypothetical protein EVAR_17285_1 [Eumeta japonica]|uniref:Uncharacterized protein n=1 Tax=Eumeta variegata TaxID=151549 RepID=A0A4C1TT20_EUMVA|nr:hypothetical protein EVAR_17285_1 [Eumeta japonica]